MSVLIASVGKPEVPSWQDEIKLQVADFFFFFFSLLILCCHGDTWFCLTYLKLWVAAAAESLQSCPALCDPIEAAHQAPQSLGLSRQEHCSGLPFPSPMHESEKWNWSRSVVSDSSRLRGPQPTRLLHPWDFPGKSTGVGCHCLLQLWDNQCVFLKEILALRYVNELCICLEICLSSRFMSIVSWAGMTQVVPTLPQNARCGWGARYNSLSFEAFPFSN